MYVAMKQVHVPTPVLDYPTVHHADVPYNTHPVSGPCGSAMDVIMCLLPIIFLVIATIPPCGLKPLSTTKSLPISALLMFLVRLMYLGSDPLLVSGSVVKGIHEAFTPLSIMVSLGEFFLFLIVDIMMYITSYIYVAPLRLVLYVYSRRWRVHVACHI